MADEALGQKLRDTQIQFKHQQIKQHVAHLMTPVTEATGKSAHLMTPVTEATGKSAHLMT